MRKMTGYIAAGKRDLARLVAIGSIVAGLAAPAAASAQWLNLPTPGLPRLANGRPDLAAAPPRLVDGRPDLQGLWTVEWIAIAPPDGVLQPWAQALMARRGAEFRKDRPAFRCLPSGPEVNPATWRRILQTPSAIAELRDDLTYRAIFLDGRTLEPDPHRTWMGYSVGRWDGDTLVVESFGYSDRTWLNPLGLPHTDALRMIERYRRESVGRMSVELTVSDPKTFTRDWTVTYGMTRRADSEMIEVVCEEGSDRWAGTVDDISDRAIDVSLDTLGGYQGTYSGLWGTLPRTVRVTLVDGQLMATGLYGQTVRLVAQSETGFAGHDGLEYEFIGAGPGPATHLVERHVSGDYTYARER